MLVLGLGFVLLAAGLVAGTAPESAVYDQRQTGTTNVRVEVKDAVVIALAGGGEGDFGGDYDYSYDYSDLTIKPPPAPSTTKKPIASSTTASSQNASETSTSSVKPTTAAAEPANATVPENASLSQGNSTKNTTVKDSSNPFAQIPVVVLQDLFESRPHKYLPVKTVDSAGTHVKAPHHLKDAINPESLPRRNCSPGFFLDGHNRCKRIVSRPGRQKPNLPIGLRYNN